MTAQAAEKRILRTEISAYDASQVQKINDELERLGSSAKCIGLNTYGSFVVEDVDGSQQYFFGWVNAAEKLLGYQVKERNLGHVDEQANQMDDGKALALRQAPIPESDLG